MLRRTLPLLAVALLGLGGLAACGDDSSSGSSSTTTSTPSSSTPSSVPAGGGAVVTEPGPVEVGVGQQVTLELASNPTTGYSWELTSAPDTAVVRIVSDTYVPPDAQIPGAGGVQRIVVEGVAAGEATLDLGYRRPWEADVPPSETASFDITVA